MRHLPLTLLVSTLLFSSSAHSQGVPCRGTSGYENAGCILVYGSIIGVSKVIGGMGSSKSGPTPKKLAISQEEATVRLAGTDTVLKGLMTLNETTAKFVKGEPVELDCRANEFPLPGLYGYGLCTLQQAGNKKAGISFGASADGNPDPSSLRLERHLLWIGGRAR